MRKLLCEKMRNFNIFQAEVKLELWKRGWTYADLGRATGYSRNYIQNTLSGSYSSRKVASRILRTLGISSKDFF